MTPDTYARLRGFLGHIEVHATRGNTDAVLEAVTDARKMLEDERAAFFAEFASDAEGT